LNFTVNKKNACKLQRFVEYGRFSPEYFVFKMELWIKIVDEFLYYDIIGFLPRLYLLIRNPIFLFKVEFTDYDFTLNQEQMVDIKNHLKITDWEKRSVSEKKYCVIILEYTRLRDQAIRRLKA